MDGTSMIIIYIVVMLFVNGGACYFFNYIFNDEN